MMSSHRQKCSELNGRLFKSEDILLFSYTLLGKLALGKDIIITHCFISYFLRHRFVYIIVCDNV